MNTVVTPIPISQIQVPDKNNCFESFLIYQAAQCSRVKQATRGKASYIALISKVSGR